MVRLTVALLTAALLTVAGRSSPAWTAISSATSVSSPKTVQACAVRFGWMHYQRYFTRGDARARVKAGPCEVDIIYSPSTPNLYFPCTVNSFGAYECATHAVGQAADPPLTGLNAVFHSSTGTVTVAHAPKVAVAKPGWVRTYPIRMGLIVPYDAHGNLRPGLTVVPAGFGVDCGSGAPERTTGLIECVASTNCFVADWVHAIYSGEQALCPTKAGSRRMRQATLSIF